MERSTTQEDLKRQVKALTAEVARLRKIAERFSDIHEKSREGYVRTALDGRIVECNASFARMLATPPEELVGKRTRDITPEPWHAEEERILREEVLDKGDAPLYEKEFLARDGQPVPVEVRTHLFHDPQGRPEGFGCFVRNIRERKRAEASLQETENKYRVLVENAYEAIIVAQDGVLKFVNPRAEQLTGYSREELTSRAFTSFIHPDDVPMVVENYRKRLEGKQFFEVYPFRVRDRQGKVRWVEIHAARILWEGRPATLNFLNEITRRKQAEDAREWMQAQMLQSQKLEAIGTLAGGVAHDFNNLLTGIQGYTDLCLMQVRATDPVYRHLKQIHQTVGRAADLVRKLLLFSRSQPMTPCRVDLNASIEDLIAMLRRIIGERVSIHADLAPDLPTVLADPGSMEQVIMNLVLNARDAMPAGGRIEIRTGNRRLTVKGSRAIPGARPGSFVCLAVRDTGVGINRELLDRVFEPFFSTKDPGEGTGLGLSTVYGIVRQHEGWVNVASEPGKGAAFEVWLPAASDAKADVAAVPAHSLKGLRGSGEGILLVEDEPGVREFAATVLQESGYRVVGAENVRQAVEIFERDPAAFSLVFSDIVLPDGTGMDLAEEILRHGPGIGVLLTSGYAEEAARWESIRQRGFAFLQKPYSVGALLQAVRDALATSAE